MAGRRPERSGAVLIAAALFAAAIPIGAERPVAQDWRRIATDADRTRLRNWRVAWIDALPVARAAAPAETAALGILVDPDRTLDARLPAAGRYRCRTVKLGGTRALAKPLSVGAWGACIVAGSGRSREFRRLDGAQRAIGRILADNDSRSIFLGALSLGDERTSFVYGRDPRRDMIGAVERIGPARWRLVLPYPIFESTLDLIEIDGLAQ